MTLTFVLLNDLDLCFVNDLDLYIGKWPWPTRSHIDDLCKNLFYKQNLFTNFSRKNSKVKIKLLNQTLVEKLEPKRMFSFLCLLVPGERFRYRWLFVSFIICMYIIISRIFFNRLCLNQTSLCERQQEYVL